MMNTEAFFIIGISVGILMIISVLWVLMKGKAKENRAILTTLILLGFVLISSPLWNQIVIKGQKWEFALYREIINDQTVKTAELIKNIEKNEKDAKVREELKRQREEIRKLGNQLQQLALSDKNRSQAEAIAKELSSRTSKAVELAVPKNLRFN